MTDLSMSRLLRSLTHTSRATSLADRVVSY
jgi:hypothetical protein